MVNYQCYRCGYTTFDKTKIKSHFNRKNRCKPLLNDIDLDDHKKYILEGLSYEQFLKIEKKRENYAKAPESYAKAPESYAKAPEKRESSPENHDFSPENQNFSEKKFENYLKSDKNIVKNLLSSNNIYNFDGKTLGKNIYKDSKKSGDIYIIQTDYITYDYYRIGVTKHLSKRISQYRCTNIYEPRVHYYFPCHDVIKIESILKNKLKKNNIKKDLYKGDIEYIKNIIISILEKQDNNNKKLFYEPELKLGDLTECLYCNKSFYTLKQVADHFDNCKDYQELLNKNNNKYECKFCNRQLFNKDSLNKHLKVCNEKIKTEEVNNSMKELIDILNKQLDDVKQEQNIKDNKYQKELEKRDLFLENQNKQINELIKKAGIIHNNNINIQNNFKLLSYKDTDTSHLSDNDIKKCLGHNNLCVPHLVQKLHFNPTKPENHNIYISNIKNNYVMKYDGEQWNLENQNEAIETLIDDKQLILEQKLEEWIENGKNYPEIMDKFNRYIDKRDNDNVLNIIKEEIKLILFNNRHLVKNVQLLK